MFHSASILILQAVGTVVHNTLYRVTKNVLYIGWQVRLRNSLIIIKGTFLKLGTEKTNKIVLITFDHDNIRIVIKHNRIYKSVTMAIKFAKNEYTNE